MQHGLQLRAHTEAAIYRKQQTRMQQVKSLVVLPLFLSSPFGRIPALAARVKVRCKMKTKAMTSLAAVGVCTMLAVMSGCCSSKSCKSECKDSVCAAGTGQPAEPMHHHMMAREPEINTGALAALLRTKVPITVLDARTGKYDDGRRVPGAKTLSPEATDAEVTALLPDKQALIVTYCANLKCPASHMLGDRLRGMGYVNVLEYHQGIEGWVAAGNAIEQVPMAK